MQGVHGIPSRPHEGGDPARVDVLVVAGGGSTRMRADDSAGPDKLDLRRGSATVLEASVAGVLGALGPRLGALVVVGPRRVLGGPAAGVTVEWAREHPPGGGPAAGVCAGLAHGSASLVAVLAGDAPYAARALPALLAALEGGAGGRAGSPVDAAVLVDATGRRVWLCAAARRGAMEAAAVRLAGGTGAPARRLFDGLAVVEVPDSWDAAADLDTPADAARLGWS